VAGTASSIKSQGGGVTVYLRTFILPFLSCLFAHLHFAIPVILSVGIPASGLEDWMGTGWEAE